MKQDKTHVIYSPSMGYLDEYLPGRLLAGEAEPIPTKGRTPARR